MTQYMIEDRRFIESATAKYITGEALCNSVARSNDIWSIYRDKMKGAIIAQCENTPIGLLVYGLKWVVV